MMLAIAFAAGFLVGVLGMILFAVVLLGHMRGRS